MIKGYIYILIKETPLHILFRPDIQKEMRDETFFCYIITVLLSGGQGVSTSVPGQFQPFACPTLDTVPTEALPTLGGGTGGDTVLVTGPPLAASTYKFRIMHIKTRLKD